MILEELLKRATKIAVEVHTDQVDRSGQPYLGHVFRVMNAGRTLEEKIVGALHDVIEDSDLTPEDLKEEGFPEIILNAVDAMTRYEHESYEEYLERVLKNPIAIHVKLNDLTDNMDLRRLIELDDESIMRMKKYHSAYRKLISKK